MSIIGPFDPKLLGNLGAEAAVTRFRELLLCEARYVGLRPDAVTISANLYVSDGGIDAQVESNSPLPEDTFIRYGRTGFQLKTGTTFKPWQQSTLKNELLSHAGKLISEVRRTLEAGGHYFLVCFGLDLTPEQRNDSKEQIAALFAGFGFLGMGARIEVFGQSQISAYVERYPSLRHSITGGSDEDFLSVSEWSKHAHMSNELVLSENQAKLVQQLREKLRGEAKHLRILGEPGIGKTRLVLEAVSAEDISPITLYVDHGERFARTQLFRELLRADSKFPLVLVLDELSEREMSEIWGHLKNRSGALKIISIDHAPDRSRDSEIEHISAPRLPDQTVRAILARHVGERTELDRWVSICEGSPRVTQAVGENLAANPDDILRSPATVPIWERFLFGYAQHQSDEARQVARIMRHIALFSRFGFEDPVGSEARYIAGLVAQADPAITWSRFQEIVQTLRGRRVLQGTRTLFIVPWALHIHLWREYWHWNGNGFDFVSTFEAMPESLHGWFMDMFRYAHGSDAAQIVRNILRRNGVFSDHNFLCSAKGTSFLSTLAEADPDATLDLIEYTIGSWSREELLAFKTNRQSIVWTLEKIAVWRPTVVRAIRMLAQMAISENASNSNNSTGTVLGLFRIGPEAAATEASPEERLPALLEMLRSDNDDFKRMGLKVAEAALTTSGMGYRIVGAEYQGIKERADLWSPKTYGDWWTEYQRYWDCLIDETRNWGDDLRREANSAILAAAGEQLRIAPHREKVLSVIEQVSADPSTDRRRLNHFIIRLLKRNHEEDDRLIHFRLRRLAGRLARQNLESRFQRYVLDTTWGEWEDYEVDAELRERTRPKRLLIALAERVTRSDEAFERLLPKLVTRETETAALYAFGEAMAAVDVSNQRLPSLLLFASVSIKSQCLGGYLAGLKARDQNKWREALLGLLANQGTANFGADLICRSGFDDQVLSACLDTFEAGWVEPGYFQSLCYGRSWQTISQDVLVRLLTLLSNRKDQISAYALVELLDQVLTTENWPVDSDFAFMVVTLPSHFEERQDTMHAYHWHRVCEKLVAYDPTKAMPLLDVLLQQMSNNYRLSYDHDVEPFAQELCHNNPAEAWEIVAMHLLSVAPNWRDDLINWLKGGIGGFGDASSVPPMAEFPLQTVLDWIAQNPEGRAAMIAHCAPSSLDDDLGGALTRALLVSYRDVDGVLSGISDNFGFGGWSGPRSQHLRSKRDRFRGWLSKGFDRNVVAWIESEITYLDKDIEAAEISEERESWNRPSNN
ncbi:MAG TPA: hypothetical protein VMV97_02320 [Sulfuriferula sp.]|nr:hypothetical protein [Sulfuriferula sp.]